MTKNNALRLGSVMLVLALLTTCALWGTFAKYTTSVESEDSARVAKWGFSAPTTEAVDLFGTAYASGAPVTEGATAATSTVYSSDTVIAPGTKNEKTITMNSTGTAPEVKYDLSVEADTTGSSTDAFDNLEGFKWTLETPVKGKQKFTKLSDLKDAIDGLSQTGIAPGTFPTEFASGTITIKVGWEWTFEDSTHADADPADGVDDRDAADTTEGNLATPNNVVLNITVKAEQVNS